jgi:S1-C subfamily serine protease
MSLKNSVLSAAALSVAFAGGVVATRVTDRNSGVEAQAAPSATAQAPATVARSTAARGLTAAPLPDLSEVAAQAIQASVNISSTQQVADPMMQFIYGSRAVQSQTSLGSGVIVSEDGLILTNSHVVGSRGAQVRVTTNDNREVAAQIKGIDPYTDLAVLKVDARGLAPLPWGDSSKLRVAEWVLAVGNPFQFNQTVTQGIVSAQNRHDPQLATYNDFIQTDAAINPGNSGGALVNSRGELIGINTMIYSETGGYQGIGFAIPVNLAHRILTELVNNGEIVRGWIGSLVPYTVTADQAKRNGLGDVGGVFIYTMSRDDPAYVAGLRPRDIVVKFNKTTVTEQSQLQRLIADAPIGSTATLEISRRGERRTLDVAIERAPQAPARR